MANLSPVSPSRDSPPTRVTAAAAIAATVFGQLVLLALAAVVFAVMVWARKGPDGVVAILVFVVAGALLGSLGGACLWVCVAAYRCKPSQLFELQILLGVSAFFGGLTAAVMMGLGAWMLYRLPWRWIRADLFEPQAGVVLLV